MPTPITEDWLKQSGFKWHQLDRQPDKHWLLWLGDAMEGRRGFTSYEDFGIELAPAWWQNRFGEDVGDVGAWHCWFRADSGGRYSRFMHVRHLSTTEDLVRLIEAVTGQKWTAADNMYGSMRRPEDAERIRETDKRLDRELIVSSGPWAKWSEVEKDDTRGRALPEHLEAHEKMRAGR